MKNNENPNRLGAFPTESAPETNTATPKESELQTLALGQFAETFRYFATKKIAETLSEGDRLDFLGLLINSDGTSLGRSASVSIDPDHASECVWQLRIEALKIRAHMGGLAMRTQFPSDCPTGAAEGYLIYCESKTHVIAQLIPIEHDFEGDVVELGECVSISRDSLCWDKLASTMGWLVPPEELLGRNLAAIIALDHKENIPLVRMLLAGYEVEKSVISHGGNDL